MFFVLFSWTDANGQNHRIWYTADENGYRAHGDVHPKVPADVRHAERTHGSQLSTHSDHVASEKSEVPEGILKQTDEQSRIRDVLKADMSKTFSNFPTVLLNHKKGRRLSGIGSDNIMIQSGDLTNSLKNLGRSTNVNIKNEEQSTKVPKVAKMISGDIAGNIQDMIHANFLKSSDGPSFVLLDRLQPPTVLKSRTKPTPIRPQLVNNRGPVDVISGLHTSSVSKSLATKFVEASTNLGPHLTRGTSVGRSRIVPQPLKVEGNLNLDNFFEPINVARTTAAPFELASLDDYYYYDYDYNDYPTGNNSSTTAKTTPPNVSEELSTFSSQPAQQTPNRTLIPSPILVIVSSSHDTTTSISTESPAPVVSSSNTGKLSTKGDEHPRLMERLQKHKKLSSSSIEKQSNEDCKEDKVSDVSREDASENDD